MRYKGEALPVLYVSVNAELGGAERIVLDLLRFHNRGRVRPLLAVLRPGLLAEEARASNVPCWVHPAGRFRNPRATWAAACFLRSIVRREGYASFTA